MCIFRIVLHCIYLNVFSEIKRFTPYLCTTATSESVNTTIYIRGVWTGDHVHTFPFSSVWGKGVQKTVPATHTHTLLKRLKKTETWSWNFSMEAENVQWINVLLVSFENLNPTLSSCLLKLPLFVHLKSLPPLSGPLLYLCIWTVKLQNS